MAQARPVIKDANRAQEAQEWVESVLKTKYDDFFEEIKDGVDLCKLINTIKPGTVSENKVQKNTKVAFHCRANIQLYIEGCAKIGIPQSERFETRDLFDGQRYDAVVDNLYALSAKSHDVAGPNFKGPHIGVKYARQNKRNFTEEQLNKSKSAVPIWNQGDHHIKQKNIDGYGIIKVDKEQQKPSQVQGVWDKGSIAHNLSSGHDSHGIVVVKNLEKHSGVQGVWDKGSIARDTSASHDSHGIVVVKNLDKHSGVQSKWEQGSLATDSSSQHDSYGVIKVPDHLQKKNQDNDDDDHDDHDDHEDDY
jgi:hypothetical protein